MKKPVCFFILSFLFNCIIQAQPYYFRHYQVEEGLSNSTVFCSAQDKNGFLWFGTKEGLNRFDGYQFKLYHTQNNSERTLNSDMIYGLYTDKKGTLWVGAEKGLFSYDEAKEKLIKVENSPENVYSIQSDTFGNLWFISGNTLYRYNIKAKALKQFLPAQYFYASSICESQDGNTWVSTTDGFLLKYISDAEGFKKYDVFQHSPSPNSKMIQKIYPGFNHSLFIGTSSQGIKEFDLTSCTYKDILTYNADMTTIFVRDIMKNSDTEFWFATESGIFIYKVDEQKFINLNKKFLDPYSITDNAVYSLCKDKEGGIWAGTFFGGINYYSKEYAAFQKYFPDNTAHSISGNAVREICEDGYGNLWIGTEDAGLNKLDKKSRNITHFKPTGKKGSIAYSNIHGLMVIENDLWIGTFEHGIDIMDVRTGEVKKHYIAGPGKNELKSNFAVCFLHHSSGKIFVGSSNGLYGYSPESDDFKRPKELDENIFVSTMVEDHDKTIWVGTHSRGIFWFNPLTGKKGHLENDPGNENSITNNSINAAYEDGNKNIWFATEGGGLCKLNRDRKTIDQYSTKNSLPSNYVFKVLEDNNQSLWISTSKGLAKFDPIKKTTVVYTKANGLLNDQFNYHSGFKDKEGKLYFGSVRGMISFRPNDIIPDTITPPLFITGLQVQNKELSINDSSGLENSISFTREITLPYYQSSVSIDFAALSYISPGMTKYGYRLKGFDKDWTYLPSNRKVYFTNLSPGEYIFKVKATKDNLTWTEEKSITIKILPPFWNTIWAYLFYALVITGIVYYLVKSYHKRHQNKKEKEIYEAKIDFFTNVAHEIKTPLTLIKGPLENLLERVDEMPSIAEDITTMDRNTNRLIDLVSQVLDFRQTEIKGFSLDFAEVKINELLKETYINFKILANKRKLVYEIDMPEYGINISADEEALRKIFSNLFTNAIKYADKQVHVRLFIPETNNSGIVVEIENDGYIIPPEMKEKIFEPFYRIKQTSKQKGTGIGLTLARSLAELHNGSLYLKEAKTNSNVFVLKLPGINMIQSNKYKYQEAEL